MIYTQWNDNAAIKNNVVEKSLIREKYPCPKNAVWPHFG